MDEYKLLHYPFVLKPLPYAYNSLEPYIDESTMHFHHDKHLNAYVNNLNAALKDYPAFQLWSLELLLTYADTLPEPLCTAVIHNGGGVYNHNFYFDNLKHPVEQVKPKTNALARAITAQFGSYDAFKEQFKKQALAVFGSGYTALIRNQCGKLQIVSTQNQDTVLQTGGSPVMLIDVWEHAYYLKYQNLRANYIDAWFQVVDMAKAEQNYSLPLG